MSNILYFDAAAGISGDMAVGALIDLGADKKRIESKLAGLGIDGFRTEVTSVKKNSVKCTDFNVILDNENYDHDTHYLYGKKDAEKACTHFHRSYADIFKIISNSSLDDDEKNLALKIFKILAEAESKAHGIEVRKVHFHEVGAVDSIVDVAAFCVAFFEIKRKFKLNGVVFSPLCEGKGFVMTQHGKLPIPVPAVVNICEKSGLKLSLTGARGEYVTPTGAAFAAAVKTGDTLPKEFKIIKSGTGSGKREQEIPGILRAFVLSSENERENDKIYKLESNIDDCSGEVLGYVSERLFACGALDVYFTPIYMKKGRPAYELCVICREEDINSLENIIFAETTTIGIRYIGYSRKCLERYFKNVKTPYGDVTVKVVKTPDGEKFYPEYESAAKAARKFQKPLDEIYSSAKELAFKKTENSKTDF